MNRAVGMAEIRWQLQDLRERLILAQAAQVKLERTIREVVRDPLNRAGMGWRAAPPLYADPSDAVGALRGMQRLVLLVYPGRKNRVKPGILLDQWEAAKKETAGLRSRYDDLRRGMASAGIEVR
jgi:hypothetical protein